MADDVREDIFGEFELDADVGGDDAAGDVHAGG